MPKRKNQVVPRASDDALPPMREGETVLDTIEHNGVICQLRVRRIVTEAGWIPICVVAPGAYRMRRYDLGWNIYEQRVARVSGSGSLAERHPELLRWIEEILPNHYTPA